jgi:hypothetical protein
MYVIDVHIDAHNVVRPIVQITIWLHANNAALRYVSIAVALLRNLPNIIIMLMMMMTIILIMVTTVLLTKRGSRCCADCYADRNEADISVNDD